LEVFKVVISINIHLLEQTEYDIIIHLTESLKNISGVYHTKHEIQGIFMRFCRMVRT